ncbi:AraC family transcriptional regulator, partial [Butyricicoccus sp.]
RITDRHGWLIRRDNNMLIGNLLYDMVRFYDENGVETDMQRSARIYRMFDLLLSPSAAEQSADTPVEQAIQYIRSHIGQPISVEELASTVCLSASYFAHMFKRRTGFSPADYVINSRIERAKVLLVRTQKPIAEIAEEVGYSTSGSLINLFVKKVGTSPRQYRIQHMSKAIDAVCKTDVPFIDTDVPEL